MKDRSLKEKILAVVYVVCLLIIIVPITVVVINIANDKYKSNYNVDDYICNLPIGDYSISSYADTIVTGAQLKTLVRQIMDEDTYLIDVEININNNTIHINTLEDIELISDKNSDLYVRPRGKYVCYVDRDEYDIVEKVRFTEYKGE